MALTPKQRRFADEYIANGFNATQAAKDAGYSKKTAYSIGNENLSKPEIEEYIRERTEAIEKARIADGDEVLRFLTSVMRGEAPETTILKNGFKFIEHEYVDQKNQLRAAEMLAKCHGLMMQKVEVSADLASAESDIAAMIARRRGGSDG